MKRNARNILGQIRTEKDRHGVDFISYISLALDDQGHGLDINLFRI